MKRALRGLILLLVVLSLTLSLCSCELLNRLLGEDLFVPSVNLDEIPEFSGKAYIKINGNKPFFEEDEITDKSYEKYGELDGLGRCTVAIACIGRDLMPTEDRGNISNVKPSGWQSVSYGGQYLYNRCHLIGFQLTGENANEKNLITGTRFMNMDGMLPFEDMVADYVKETENHVMYRVTPIYEGDNLVAKGVLMEAYSVEDEGEICFCVFVYNNQPGIAINYANGESKEDDGVPFPDDNEENEPPEIPDGGEENPSPVKSEYAVNTSTKKYHETDCRYAFSKNVEVMEKTAEELEAEGYTACGVCKPE